MGDKIDLLEIGYELQVLGFDQIMDDPEKLVYRRILTDESEIRAWIYPQNISSENLCIHISLFYKGFEMEHMCVHDYDELRQWVAKWVKTWSRAARPIQAVHDWPEPSPIEHH